MGWRKMVDSTVASFQTTCGTIIGLAAAVIVGALIVAGGCVFLATRNDDSQRKREVPRTKTVAPSAPQPSRSEEPITRPIPVQDHEPPPPAPVDYREYLGTYLEVQPGAMDSDQYRHLNISGTVTNGGDRPVKNVSITVVCYGPNGLPVHSTSFIPSWYIEPSVIQPGAIAAFTGWIMYEANLNAVDHRAVVNRYSFAD